MKCFGEYSHNNPARRRDAIRRHKKRYEKTTKGKEVRRNNYIAKIGFLTNCKAQIGCLGFYYDEDAHMEVSCLENDPIVLVFHHINPEEKKFLVSGACVTRSWADILKEIEKCTVLCFNCHQKIHDGVWDYRKIKNGEFYKKEKALFEQQLLLKIPFSS